MRGLSNARRNHTRSLLAGCPQCAHAHAPAPGASVGSSARSPGCQCAAELFADARSCAVTQPRLQRSLWKLQHELDNAVSDVRIRAPTMLITRYWPVSSRRTQRRKETDQAETMLLCSWSRCTLSQRSSKKRGLASCCNKAAANCPGGPCSHAPPHAISRCYLMHNGNSVSPRLGESSLCTSSRMPTTLQVPRSCITSIYST